MFIQEAWILNSNKHVLTTIHDNYLGNGVSGVPENVLLRGRPYGGVGILWKKTLANKVKFKTISNTERACAVEIKHGENVLLCINAYLPNDTYSKTHVADEFLETLDTIEVFYK